jgi:hypothetical protein
MARLSRVSSETVARAAATQLAASRAAAASDISLKVLRARPGWQPARVFIGMLGGMRFSC